MEIEALGLFLLYSLDWIGRVVDTTVVVYVYV